MLVDIPELTRGNKTFNKGLIKEHRVIDGDEILVGDLGVVEAVEKVVTELVEVLNEEGEPILNEEGNPTFESQVLLDQDGEEVTEMVDEFKPIHTNFYLHVDRLGDYGVTLTDEQLTVLRGGNE